MNNIIKTTPLFLSLLASSCSTMKNSLTLGTISGATIGAFTAHSVSLHHKGKRTSEGLAMGALIGGITSYLIHKGLENRDEKVRREVLFNLENFGIEQNSNQDNFSTWKKLRRKNYVKN